MNNTTYTIEQLQELSWQQIIKLTKGVIIAILDELSLDYVESSNYFKLCSTLYQHLKQLRVQQLITQVESTPPSAVQASTDEVLVDVEFHNMSFRELQLRSIGKFPSVNQKHTRLEPITKPTPAICKVLRVHDNGGSFYGLPVLRVLVQDTVSKESWWTGSSKADGITPGQLVRECTDIQGYPVDWVVPLQRKPITTN